MGSPSADPKNPAARASSCGGRIFVGAGDFWGRRRWTGRQGLSGLEKQPTSLWCPSWAASASHLGLDTNFVHVVQGKKAHDVSMHSRGWR